jgi:hypothetical protein
MAHGYGHASLARPPPHEGKDSQNWQKDNEEDIESSHLLRRLGIEPRAHRV